MAHIQEYVPVVGQGIIDELYLLAERLKGISIQTVNSTAVGGGVAEILNCMVPLINELGVEMYWDLIKGGESFFNVTKKFHNALHGKPEARLHRFQRSGALPCFQKDRNAYRLRQTYPLHRYFPLSGMKSVRV